MSWTQTRIDPLPLHGIRERLREVQGLRVFLRVDLNLPTGPGHEILCDYRLRRVVGLINVLTRLGCRVIVASHFGRPRGRSRPGMSLLQFVGPMSRLLASPPTFLPTCVGPQAEAAIAHSRPGSVFLLENLRFHAGEVAASPEFAEQLARLADIYINDAFSVSHRYHASNVLLPRLLPAYAGPAFVHEYERAVTLVNAIRPPLVVISGGRKLEKLLVYRQLLPRIDHLLLGSGFAPVYSRHPKIMGNAAITNSRVVTPPDLVIRTSTGELGVVDWAEMPSGAPAIDIGPRALAMYTDLITSAGTLLFNGAPGALSSGHPLSSHRSLMHAFVSSKALKAVFGGTGCSLFIGAGLARSLNYIFPGGGALLSFINNQGNPAIPLLVEGGGRSFFAVAPSQQPEAKGADI